MSLTRSKSTAAIFLEESLLPDRDDDDQPTGGSGGDGAPGLDPDEESFIRARMNAPTWTLDRGLGYYGEERKKKNVPALLEKGR